MTDKIKNLKKTGGWLGWPFLLKGLFIRGTGKKRLPTSRNQWRNRV